MRIPAGLRLAWPSAVVAVLLVANWIYQFASEAGKYAVLLGPGGNHGAFPY